MRMRANLKWVAVAGLTVLAGSATAQQAPAMPPPANPDGQVNLERHVQLSPQDEVAQGEVVIKRIGQASEGVKKQLEKARVERDVVKTLCLNDKLSQIDVAARSAKERLDALRAAVLRADTELAGHEFTILTVLRQRGDQLTAEANQCIGQEVSFVAETVVVPEIDPTIPGEDPSFINPVDVGLIFAPPLCVSCTGKR